MRNNEDRLGAATTTGDSETSVSSNSLNFVAPTEFVDLPSGGKFYPLGHPLHEKTEIEIKFMTAKEEDILTSRSLLKKGVAIDRMLENLIVDRDIKLNSLLTGDKNAIMVAARISAYGAKYNIEARCPSCNNKEKPVLNLLEIGTKIALSPKECGLNVTDRKTFSTTLPRSGLLVEFRLLTSQDEAKIAESILKNKDDSAGSTNLLKTLIVSVNGDTNPASVNNVVDNLPASDARFVRNLIKDITPDLDMKFLFSCTSCEYEEELEVPLTAEFFWPK